MNYNDYIHFNFSDGFCLRFVVKFRSFTLLARGSFRSTSVRMRLFCVTRIVYLLYKSVYMLQSNA